MRLKQILINLISNAVRYSASNTEIHVEIDAKRTPVDPNQPDESLLLNFVVRDQGIGIPEAELGRIFKPFYQVQRTSVNGSTGLGLYIVHEIVKAMGAHVSCQSTVGKGTSFRVESLAFQISQDAPVPSHFEAQLEKNQFANTFKFSIVFAIIALYTNAKPIESNSKQNANSFHILLAEDNPINQRIFFRLICDLGFACSLASNGQEAFALWNSNPQKFSMILMDLQVKPEMLVILELSLFFSVLLILSLS